MQKLLMEMESSKGRKESEDKQMDWFVFLPDAILVDILKRFPDAFLRYKAKYVCRRWFDIITNRILLTHASCILQNILTLKTRVVDIREEEEGLLVKEQDLYIPHKGIIRSWCNELVLISHSRNLLVYNLITNKRSHLPKRKVSCGCGRHYTSKCAVTLCFDGFKGIYKVVHLFKGPPLQCETLVLGSDIFFSKWKEIKVPYMKEGQYCERDPVLVEGRYLHWDVVNSNYMMSMDIVKEKIFKTKLPGSGYHWISKYSSFVMGRNVAMIEKDIREKAGIWILKDLKKKKWEKLHSVYVSKFLENARYPVSSVMSKRYIILESRSEKRLFSYDLKDRVVKEIKHSESYAHCVVHSSAPSFI